MIVGDFDTKEALGLVHQYLGRIPKSSTPVPRDIPREPPQTKERRVRLEENWPLPAVVVAHHITYDGDPDSYPLHVASKVLSDGQSSRIYRKLVYEKGTALAAFGQGNLIEDPNLFYAVAIVQPGHTPEETIEALIGELDRLRHEPISAAELQQAKNQFARDYVFSRESNKDKAEILGHAAVLRYATPPIGAAPRQEQAADAVCEISAVSIACDMSAASLGRRETLSQRDWRTKVVDFYRLHGASSATIFRVLAWACVPTIAILSLVPGAARPHTDLPGLAEHSIAYAGTGFFFALGYIGLQQRLCAWIGLAIAACVFEILQRFSPGRSPSLFDALASIGGLTLGLAVGAGGRRRSVSLERIWTNHVRMRSMPI